MNGINAELLRNRENERHGHDRRKNLHHHSDDDEKTIEDQQEGDLAADLLRNNLEQSLRTC